MARYEINVLGKRYTSLDVAPLFDGYSGVEIVVDDDTTYFAGTETGRVITIQNPWGTQAQADRILSKIEGWQYQPYMARGALLDPAAELGDGVVMNGMYSGLYKIDRNYSALMATDISAPEDEEINHEYPFSSRSDREIVRKFKAVESEFVLQSNLIAAKVSQIGGDNQSFGWQLLSDHFSLFSGNNEVFRVDDSGAEVKGIITATGGKIGNFNIGRTAIWNNIPDFANSGGLTSGVYLGTDGIRLGKNFTVDTSGNVAANNMTLTGTLKIGGTNITANALRSGAQSAYNNSGTWTTGSGYGFNYNKATQRNTTEYPDYFTAKAIYAVTEIGCNFLNGKSITCEALKLYPYTATWKTATIGGVTINYLGR